jgi:hypothetical protein
MTRGNGSDVNPLDGDRIFIELSILDGRIASVGAKGVVVAVMSLASGVMRRRELATGAEARATGHETFAGCETARRAALALGRLAHGKSAEEAFAISVRELMLAIGYVAAENERCVLTAIGALRSALIDAHVTALAEATVEAKTLSLK